MIGRVLGPAGRSAARRSAAAVRRASSTADDGALPYDRITFVGTGKMAQAMIDPLISQGLQDPGSICAYDVSEAALDTVASLYPGIDTAASIPDAVSGSNLIVYAVKPQNCARVHAEIRRAKSRGGTVRDDAAILSVVAGKPARDFLESGIDRVARSMPNTPARIGAGVTVWSCTENVDLAERGRIRRVLNSFGQTVFVDDESFIDMSTSISGSGPAYVFLLMEAMIDAGVHMGFSRETATTLVHHTLLGSTKYAMSTDEHPAVLRNSVTSPAGTTASAIYELESGGFRTVVKDAIWACYRRSLEMGGQSSHVGPNRARGAAPPPPPHPGPGGTSHHPVEPPVGEMPRSVEGRSG